MDNESSDDISLRRGQIESPKSITPQTIANPTPTGDRALQTQEGALQAIPGKAGRPKGKLGRKTQVFMELIVAGHSTQEAYRLAGYSGQKNAAYVLRSNLRDLIEERLKSDGISREGAKIELKKLLDLPLNPDYKDKGISIKEKIQLLKFLDKLTEKEEGRMPTITPFVVQVNEPKQVNITEQK